MSMMKLLLGLDRAIHSIVRAVMPWLFGDVLFAVIPLGVIPADR
jgi:hypothetical protein